MSTNLVVQDIWTESVDQKAWRLDEETQSRSESSILIPFVNHVSATPDLGPSLLSIGVWS